MEKGGARMNANTLWNLFLETGSPEIYLLYRRAAGDHAREDARESV